MVDMSKKSPCLELSLYQCLHWTRCSVLTVMLVLLIGTGHEMRANGSFMQKAKAVVDNFYSRYNTTSAVDLVFVLDRSGSVNRGGWKHMITFVRNLLDPFLVDEDHARVAMVLFNSEASIAFNDLEQDMTNESATKCSIYRHLHDLTSSVGLSGHTATDAAFSKAFQILQNARPDTKKAVVLITDGDSNVGNPPKTTSLLVQHLKWGQNWNTDASGPQVEIFAFGIANVTAEFLQSIVSDLSDHFSHFPDFYSFYQFTESIHTGIRDNVEDQWRDVNMSNCLQTCDQLNSKCMCGAKKGQFSCACRPGYEAVGSTCKACPIGYYKEGFVPGVCRQCPQNSTTSAAGATNSSSCHPLPGHRKCPDLSNIEHGGKFYVSGTELKEVANTGRDCKDVHDGNSCHYECDTGYRLLNGTKVMKCNPWGIWEGAVPRCEIVDCDRVLESWANATHATLRYDNSTTTYGSVISASCRPGLVAFGPTVWTCGEHAIWNGQSYFQCKEVHCGALTPIDNAVIVPADCATMRKPLGYQCQMICREGFQHTGPGNFTCSFKNGTFWKPRAGEEGLSKCHDIQGPTIDCPPNITIVPSDWKDCMVIKIHKDQPTIYDNSGSGRYRIFGEPENDTFCVGHTYLTYEAYDMTGNTKKCERVVHVIAKNVDIISCPNDTIMTVNSSIRSHFVSWPEPIFHGRSGERLPITCSRPANGSVFNLGVESVVCYHSGYPSSKCEFKVDIREPPCLLPFPDRVPLHGQVECDNITILAKRCYVKCHDGYEFIHDESETPYFCAWDGSWSKNGIWPQCHRSRRANHAQSVNHLLAEINGSTCEQKPGQIINSFIQKVNGILGDKLGPCKAPCKCSLPSVNISESCTDRRLRLRRSDASLTSATSATESVGSDVHVEVSTGNFSLAFAVRATLNDAAIPSSITKSEQKEIIEILDEVYYNMTQTIADGQFTWQAEDHLVTAVALKSDGPKFVDFNCASNEVSQVTEKSAACFTCAIGTYYHNGSCDPCPIGSYKDYDGEGPCKPCDNSGSTASEGARSSSECLNPCLPGYSSLTGYENCTACWKGMYQSEIRSKSCYRCPDNQTTSSDGSTTILDCYEPVSCSAYKKTCGSHGSCIRKQEVVLCLCEAGFTGVKCEDNIDDCEHSLCKNNGTCIDRIAAYDCNCSSSFTGNRCETEVDECASFPCQNGGTCIDNFISYNCVCPQGFGGIHCETDIDECAPNPCVFGTCRDGINNFSCSCFDNYTGHVCDRQRDFCSNVTCYNGGKCIGSKTAPYCSCLKGYTGTNCESEIETCASAPCQNNSTCISYAGSFHCLCPPGFIGDTCELGVSPDFDLVFPKSSTVNFVRLKLKLGESSSLQQVSVCAWMRYSDVQNSGTLWSYATDRSGYLDNVANVLTAKDSGNLEIFVNGEVAKANISLNDGIWHHLCFVWSSGNGEWILYLNGTRRRQGSHLAEGTYIRANGILILGQKQNNFGDSFNSDENFIGELTQFSVFSEVLSDADIIAMASVKSGSCELGHQGNAVSWTDVLHNIQGNVAVRNSSWCNDVNECLFTNLNNCTDGTCCKDVLGSFICVKCGPPGCANVKCQNGGTCKTDASGSYCECAPGYTGSNCDEMQPTCNTAQCMNGGTCDRQTGKCLCVKPWIGDYCKVQSVIKCSARPCANGGTCRDLRDGYRCECPPLNSILGQNCEILSVCASSPCKSGGTCVINGATYLCECLAGLSGQNCEIGSPAVCQNVTCKNGGTCQVDDRRFKCSCTGDFQGTYCENLRESESSKATIYISVVIIAILIAIIIVAIIYIYVQRKRIASTFQMPSIPMSISNQMYLEQNAFATQNRSTVQDTIYSDPVELLPYATSGETDRDSDLGADGQTKQQRIRNSHQSIPLPPKPDDANSPALSGRSLAEWNHATPPPPYSADVHAPVPPVRQLPNTLLPSMIIQHSLANQPQATPGTCYFMPISDEEADNPESAAESAYLIPRQEVESRDSAENNTAYLVPTINNDTEDAGGAIMAPAGSTELCNGSEVMYAIRSLPCEPSEDKSNKPLLHK